jgi:hypothetical protein
MLSRPFGLARLGCGATAAAASASADDPMNEISVSAGFELVRDSCEVGLAAGSERATDRRHRFGSTVRLRRQAATRSECRVGFTREGSLVRSQPRPLGIASLAFTGETVFPPCGPVLRVLSA